MRPISVMFGAGAIGRGFLGQLLSESGYEVVFVDIDEDLLEAFNRKRSYPIRLVDNTGGVEIFVSPVRGLHSKDQSSVAEAVASAGVAATAVGARVLPLIAPLVAQGVVGRAVQGNEDPLNFIICENLKDAATSFRQMVAEYIPTEYQTYFANHIGFVDTVIGRMVPPPTSQMRAIDPTLIIVEPYKELPVDLHGFVGEIPAIVGMIPSDNFAAYTARKLYIHNCGHAVLAYLGYLGGYEYGYEALADTAIIRTVEQALAESKAGIVSAHCVEVAWLETHIADLLRRFANRSLGDTVLRLGRDPLRKLAPKDRLVGAARLAEAAGVLPDAICWGIAAAYHFAPTEDPLALDLQARIQSRGLPAVLADASGIQPDEKLGEMIIERYHHLKTKKRS